MDSNHSLSDQIYSLAAGSNQLSVPICQHICLLFTINSQHIRLLFVEPTGVDPVSLALQASAKPLSYSSKYIPQKNP